MAYFFQHEGEGDFFMKLVITVLGQDRVGIIAGVSRVLADNQVNILSINQTILDGLFNMVLMGQALAPNANIEALQEELKALGNELGVEIRAQHADIFYSMHRVG